MIDEKHTDWNRMVPELTVSDLPASLHFYTEVLGFTVIIRRHQPEFAYIALGEAQLMLEAYHDQGWNTAELTRPFGRGVNFQIEIDDVNPVLASLQDRHIPLYRQLRDNFYHIGTAEVCQREFLVQDPDGYLLRFSQYIESPPSSS
ncbi:bleomycin resistance protein [Erwinia piriflorinigrans]|uniref:Bleomycin resistance protein n=1 Tax=Erwinia piriflorinigrans CFBP 5888 TaxID=1161919 RepID=V5ZB04_9GAMM|nr:VOC family protein [Erwinia piriflorinigrans]CCG88548.1 Bleomycin resistance protein BRP [Erwinia piriflorinigrans CFBP 5888]